ncbi:MAG: AraC family transcriptional regulator [Dysgonamonadaceae bacterium]|jgi:AraC family transcriptional regulator|nr:AraC family transcriptional regulator [Dysgonamonadaceae bacterium]
MEQKISTKEDYQKRVDAVKNFIEQNLKNNFRLAELADVANFSKWHFQHIMHAFLGEPVWAYVMRRRLERAAILLRKSDLSVSEIAYECGYDVPSSLSKVFKMFYHVSPMEYRNNLKINIMNVLKVNEELSLKSPKMIDLNEKKVIYLQLVGKYPDLDFGGAYRKLWQFVKNQKLFSAGIEHIAVFIDCPEDKCKCDNCDTPHCTCDNCDCPDCITRTNVCLVVPKAEVGEGEIGITTIAGGKYAKFVYQGPYSGFSAVYDAIYSRWLPESGLKLRDCPSFEKYINNPERVEPEKLKTEIYVPIE